MKIWTAIVLAAVATCTCGPGVAAPPCDLPQHEIVVDGKLDDWTGIAPNVMQSKEHLRVDATLVATPRFVGRQNDDGTWGIAVLDAGLASARQARPLQVEIGSDSGDSVEKLSGGYSSLVEQEGGWTGSGSVAWKDGVAFDFQDRWSFDGGQLRLKRRVTVRGDGPGES